MNIKYSKPLGDIQSENIIRLQSNDELVVEQRKTSATLATMPQRQKCVLCGLNLAGEKFTHRRIGFIQCQSCSHIQTANLPANGYPFANYGFNKIYPQLNPQDYINRIERIYQPKLTWVLETLQAYGYSEEVLKNRSWSELGCGAGYFLVALKDWGADKIYGVDADKELVDLANQHLNSQKVDYLSGKLAMAIQAPLADIYVAWFVLEHLEDTYDFLNRLKLLPSGTLFIFSVPVFGYSCLIEGMESSNLYARNLDGVVHTQIYTDESIAYAMNLAGYDIIARWIFGQDAQDCYRQIYGHLMSLPQNIRDKFISQAENLTDSLQKVFDELHLADQRHVVAIKK